MNINEYQSWTRSTAIYPEDQALVYLALGLCEEAGEIAGKIKKMIRDDGGVMTPERREALADELGDLNWYLARFSDHLSYQSGAILVKNVAKLTSRKKRNKLQGDGDNR